MDDPTNPNNNFSPSPSQLSPRPGAPSAPGNDWAGATSTPTTTQSDNPFDSISNTPPAPAAGTTPSPWETPSTPPAPGYPMGAPMPSSTQSQAPDTSLHSFGQPPQDPLSASPTVPQMPPADAPVSPTLNPLAASDTTPTPTWTPLSTSPSAPETSAATSSPSTGVPESFSSLNVPQPMPAPNPTPTFTSVMDNPTPTPSSVPASSPTSDPAAPVSFFGLNQITDPTPPAASNPAASTPDVTLSSGSPQPATDSFNDTSAAAVPDSPTTPAPGMDSDLTSVLPSREPETDPVSTSSHTGFTPPSPADSSGLLALDSQPPATESSGTPASSTEEPVFDWPANQSTASTGASLIQPQSPHSEPPADQPALTDPLGAVSVPSAVGSQSANEPAPTDLSQLITSTPNPTTPNSTAASSTPSTPGVYTPQSQLPETLVTQNPSRPLPTDTSDSIKPKVPLIPLVMGGIILVLVVVAAIAYFVLTKAQSPTTSLPIIQPAALTNPPTTHPSAAVSPVSSTSASPSSSASAGIQDESNLLRQTSR